MRCFYFTAAAPILPMSFSDASAFDQPTLSILTDENPPSDRNFSIYPRSSLTGCLPRLRLQCLPAAVSFSPDLHAHVLPAIEFTGLSDIICCCPHLKFCCHARSVRVIFRFPGAVSAFGIIRLMLNPAMKPAVTDGAASYTLVPRYTPRSTAKSPVGGVRPKRSCSSQTQEVSYIWKTFWYEYESERGDVCSPGIIEERGNVKKVISGAEWGRE